MQRVEELPENPARELSQLEESKVFDYYPNLGKVRAFVRENFKQPISLADAAEVASLERRYFSTYFHQRVGICFHDWVTAVRVRRAIGLIEKRDCPLGWVCDEAGFGNPRTFQRAFKKWTGETARDFRAKVREEAVETGDAFRARGPRDRGSSAPYVTSPRVGLARPSPRSSGIRC